MLLSPFGLDPSNGFPSDLNFTAPGKIFSWNNCGCRRKRASQFEVFPFHGISAALVHANNRRGAVSMQHGVPLAGRRGVAIDPGALDEEPRFVSGFDHLNVILESVLEERRHDLDGCFR
jgi:hypothetical protein